METFISKLLAQPQAGMWIKAAPWVLALSIVWTLVWKGMALWKAARLSSKKWFIVLLLINTMGILEIIYIYVISKKSRQENEN